MTAPRSPSSSTSLSRIASGIADGGGASGRRGLEIPFVDGDVAALGAPVARESASAGAFFTTTQELHRVGNDIDCLAFRALLGLPLAPLEAPVDRHGASLRQIARG